MNENKCLFEVCCFNAESAIEASKNGADRVEFCTSYKDGGLTPAREDILFVQKNIFIPLHIMVRPKAENFIYSIDEIEEMKNTIQFCKENNIDGVVFGILNIDNTINIKICKELVKLALPMKCTLHKAFDVLKNSEKNITDAIECGFDYILTSTKYSEIKLRINELEKIIKISEKKIKIIACGNIRAANIDRYKNILKICDIHSACIVENKFDTEEIFKMKTYFEIINNSN